MQHAEHRHHSAHSARQVNSPDCYYLDSWDNTAIRDELLVPLGPGGNRRYRTAVMDCPLETRSTTRSASQPTT